MVAALSFIEEHEVIEATGLIREKLGISLDRIPSERMAVKIYVRGDELIPFANHKGETKFVAVPDTHSCQDKYRNIAALVIAQGPNCYKGKQFERSGPWCRVGDWVLIPRQGGRQISYQGIPIQIIHQTGIWMVLEDPEHVERY